MAKQNEDEVSITKTKGRVTKLLTKLNNMILNSEIVKEGKEKITIVEIKKVKRLSTYTDIDYTLAFIKDQHDRKITAAGRWVEDWKEGDEVEGILQEKAKMLTGHKETFVSSSLFLKNPNANY